MFNPIAQYASLFKITGAKDETHATDNLFSVSQAQSNIPGSWSGNTGDRNTNGSFNNINTFMLPSVTDFGVRNQGSVPGVGGAGIIRIPGGYLAKN